MSAEEHVYYLRSTATSPVPTDPGALANEPAGANVFTGSGFTPSLLSTSFGVGTASLTLTDAQTRSCIFVTQAGVPGLTTLLGVPWHLKVRVIGLTVNAGAPPGKVELSARVLRLDSGNVVVEAGSQSVVSIDTTIDMAVDALPKDLHFYIPATTFSAGSAADRMAVQLVATEAGSPTNVTLQIDLANGVSYIASVEWPIFAGMEDFKGIGAFDSRGAPGCSVAQGGLGCGVPLDLDDSDEHVYGPRFSLAREPPCRWEFSEAPIYTFADGPFPGDRALLPAVLDTATDFISYALPETAVEPKDTFLCGFWLFPGRSGTTRRVVTVGDSTSNPAGYSLGLQLNAADQWELRTRHNSGPETLLATATGAPSVVAWQHVEFIYRAHTTLGAWIVRINGVDLTWDSAATGRDTIAGQPPSTIWGWQIQSSVNLIAHPYFYYGDGGFDASDMKASPGRLPRISSLRPISQGSNSAWDRWAGDPRALVGSGNSTNWTYVSAAPDDAQLTSLRSATASARDSWNLEPLSSDALSIIAVMSQVSLVCPSYLETSYPFGSLRHELYDGATPVESDTEHAAHYPDQDEVDDFRIGARQFATAPAGGAWEPSHLTSGIQMGVRNADGTEYWIGGAQLLVLWAGAPVPSTPDTGESCAPCSSTTDATFLDSMLSYDGRNSLDGGITVSEEAMSLSINPAGDWDTIGATHLLTCSAALFTGGDAFYVGKAMRLTGADGESVVLDIINHNVGDTTLDVTNRTAVPASCQTIDIVEWALMIEVVSLAHLEGKSVLAIADGVPQAEQVVGAGTLTLDDHAAVIHAGLKVIGRIETLDIDANGLPSAIADKQKNVPTVSLYVEATNRFKVGSSFSHLTEMFADPQNGFSGANATGLFTRKLVDLSRRGHRLDDGGRTYIQADKGLPATILAIVSNVAISDNNRRGGS